ncbi:unnamed protein product [Discula destructiva]
MNNIAPEPHLLPRLRRRVQGVVVAVQSVQQRRLARRLVLECHVRCLRFRRREVLRGGALGSTPVALPYEEGAANGARVDIAGACVDQILLDLQDGARPALVVDAEDLGADLESAALRGSGQGLQELDQALAVDNAGVVKVRHTGDFDGLLGSVEVNHLLGGALECCTVSARLRTRSARSHLRLGCWTAHPLTQYERVGWEDGEVRVELLRGRQYLDRHCHVKVQLLT